MAERKEEVRHWQEWGLCGDKGRGIGDGGWMMEGEIHFLSDRFWNWGYTFEDGKHLFSRLNQSVVFVALVARGCLLVGRWL